MPTIGKRVCPTCHQSTNPYKIQVMGAMVQSLWRVWKYCQEKQTRRVTRKQIKHLLYTDVEAARFGDWRYFGLIDKPKKGEYLLRMDYVERFFRKQCVIPKYVWKDRVTKKVTWPTDRKEFVDVLSVPKLGDLMDELGEYVVEYQQSLEPESKQTSLL